MKIGYVNPPVGEDLDYATLLPWLASEYPDGWVIVHGRPAHPGVCMAMLGFSKADDTLVPLFLTQTAPASPFHYEGDACRFCKHERKDHHQPASVACNHAMCVCFHFEENSDGGKV
jgi:hypothetical protein